MKWFFWIIPILLFIFQLIFTLNSQTQIRYEDLAESVRNVFWLEQGRVYDGVSTNVGWYGTLLGIYKLFGFHLHAAQFFKLGLYLISITCLAAFLKKYIRHAWLPLLVIGLSPTLLYYNTTQTSHGIDLLYFPVVLFLITHERRLSRAKSRDRLLRLIGWVLACWAWMSYPTFIFYLPALGMIGGIREIRGIRGILISVVAFILPLAVMVLFIKNNSLLFFDPQISSGIFRGGGNFEISLDNISHNLGGLVTDLFVRGSSYHFEAYLAEFSLIFPILALVLVVGISLRAFKYNNYNFYNRYIILALASGLAVLVLSSLTLDPSGFPGMRRYTPVLAAFYALFVLAWQSFQIRETRGIWLMRGVLGLLLLHHMLVYPINLIHLKDPSPDVYPIWFNSAETPKKSLQNLVDTVQKEDLKLVCLDEKGTPFYCRLAEVYAAVAGSCTWNHLDCHQILGYDFKTGQFIPLDVKLWDEYYFGH